ncbi:ABC transporter ATP-binding protein [uncultured Tyzzerella sp.]|uniref:ABC transporter ATP-binding protein n=1 Tax=uncultured Tyzzerella sp. TaxID=2321398 RepID=UPI002943985E|nr:ABC transporter ATP-binding protein [uncultured Tyzzerella sp.]
MDNVLEVKNLTKKYKDVGIENISFNVPKGSIVGLIGRNGAGKTTTIKTILDIAKKDSGEVVILGDSDINEKIKNNIGVVFDGDTFPETLTVKNLNNILKNIYKNWNEELYFKYVEKLELPVDKKFKQFSKGMKMKLSIIVSLSYDAKLLILDEPTSGLDPVVREEILDIFLDFIQDENKGILVSSHITSDLEKVADYIVFIDKGNVIFFESKDKIIYEYGILKCSQEDLKKIDNKYILKKIKKNYGYDAVLNDREHIKQQYPSLIIDTCTIDELMVIYTKGDNV